MAADTLQPKSMAPTCVKAKERDIDQDDLIMAGCERLDSRSRTHLLRLIDELLCLESSGYAMIQERYEICVGNRAVHKYVSTSYMNTLVRNSRDVLGIRVYSGKSPLVAILTRDELKMRASIRSSAYEQQHVSAYGDLVSFMLQQTIQVRQQGFGDIPFVDHCKHHLDLLRSCHAAAFSTDTPTVNANLRRSKERFRTYVLFNTIDKIGSRLRFGKGKRNFYAIMSRRDDKIAKADYDKNDIDPILLTLKPTSAQKDFLLAFWEASGEDDDTAQRLSTRPIYDSTGRLIFQHILSRLVRQLYNGHAALAKEMDFGSLSNDRIRSTIEQRKESIRELFTSFKGYSMALHWFVAAFDVGPQEQNSLVTHLAWLQRLSGAVSPRDRDWLFHDPVDHEETDDSSDSDDEYEDEEADQIEQSMSKRFPRYGRTLTPWTKDALGFLRMVCLTEDSISRVTNIQAHRCQSSEAQMQESRCVQSAIVAVVEKGSRHQ